MTRDLKFEIKAREVDAWALFKMLPESKLLICNLPPNADGLVNADFTSAIGIEGLKKLFHQVENGHAMMESLKINL